MTVVLGREKRCLGNDLTSACSLNDQRGSRRLVPNEMDCPPDHKVDPTNRVALMEKGLAGFKFMLASGEVTEGEVKFVGHDSDHVPSRTPVARQPLKETIKMRQFLIPLMLLIPISVNAQSGGQHPQHGSMPMYHPLSNTHQTLPTIYSVKITVV